ncbi:MAG: hypothetical protein EA376_01370 [Phycisphaeraceae bacterium]|nr:MAG: hypothetical protein EA376_01370 [Phycisphaeraceae bacterium]
MNVTWIIPALSLTLAAAGLALLAWSLFWDRARGRRRCPKCWYDMAGAVGLVCPECGRDAKREREMLRTRRRWGWAVAGCLVIVGAYGVYVGQAVRARGWAAAVPSWALVHLVPVLSHERGDEWMQSLNHATWREIEHRRSAGTLRALKERMLMNRIARVNAGDPDPIIIVRDGWPTGMDIHIEVLPPLWVQGRRGRVLVVTPRAPGMAQASAHVMGRDALVARNATYYGRLSLLQNIGTPPPGVTRIELDIELREGPPSENRAIRGYEQTGGSNVYSVVWRSRQTLELARADGADESLTEFSSPAIESVLRESANVSIKLDHLHDRALVETRMDWEMARRSLCKIQNDVLALRMEILRDGEVVATGYAGLEHVASRRSGAGMLLELLHPVSAYSVVAPLSEQFAAIGIEDSEWTARLAGDPHVALRYPDAARYWKGEVVVPVTSIEVLDINADEREIQRWRSEFRMRSPRR